MTDDISTDALHLGWCTDADPVRNFIHLQRAGETSVFLHARQLRGVPPPTRGRRREPLDTTLLQGDVAFVFELEGTHKRSPEAREARPVSVAALSQVVVALETLSWSQRDGLWRCLPESVREAVLADHIGLAPATPARVHLRARFPELVSWMQGLTITPHVSTTITAEAIQSRKRPDDAQLVAVWGGGDLKDLRPYDRIRLISARRAEHAAHLFCAAMGASTKDVSLQQLSAHAVPGRTDWTQFDVRVETPHPGLPHRAIDVKNTRKIRGSADAPDICVPDFKRARQGGDVAVLGCLSEYQRSIEEAHKQGMGDVEILGFCTQATVARLRAGVGTLPIELHLQRPGRGRLRFVPPWMFGLPGRRWPAPPELDRLPDAAGLTRLELHPLPLWLAAGRALPPAWQELVPDWAHPLWERLRRCKELPDVYLTILTDFLMRLTRDDADWDAGVLRSMLVWPRDPVHLLGVHDPTRALLTLIQALTAMWQERASLRLRRYSRFRLPNALWVQGHGRGGWETIVSYCGGMIDKAPCGRWPLVRGRQTACETCGWLACPTCGHCKKMCTAGERRVEEESHRRADAREVARLKRGIWKS